MKRSAENASAAPRAPSLRVDAESGAVRFEFVPSEATTPLLLDPILRATDAKEVTAMLVEHSGDQGGRPVRVACDKATFAEAARTPGSLLNAREAAALVTNDVLGLVSKYIYEPHIMGFERLNTIATRELRSSTGWSVATPTNLVPHCASRDPVMCSRPNGDLLVLNARVAGAAYHKKHYAHSLSCSSNTATRALPAAPCKWASYLSRMNGDAAIATTHARYLLFNGASWQPLTHPVDTSNLNPPKWHRASACLFVEPHHRSAQRSSYLFDPTGAVWRSVTPSIGGYSNEVARFEEHAGTVFTVNTHQEAKLYEHREDRWQMLTKPKIHLTDADSLSLVAMDEHTVACYVGRECVVYESRAACWQSRPAWNRPVKKRFSYVSTF